MGTTRYSYHVTPVRAHARQTRALLRAPTNINDTERTSGAHSNLLGGNGTSCVILHKFNFSYRSFGTGTGEGGGDIGLAFLCISFV